MMKLFDIDKFRDKHELFAYLIENKSNILSKKKAKMKTSDGMPISIITSKDTITTKAIGDDGVIKATLVINTTNLLDSHKDVHIPKLWTKSIQEQRYINLNREHKDGFDNIIADGKDLKAYVRDLTWGELGFNYKGITQALLYDAKIRKERNSFMFEQYKNGHVRNHSVEMYYVKILMAVNDPQYKDEFAIYEKYFDMIANKEDETEGYFFPVLEAKQVGGAAVIRGSNFATPVYDIKDEPDDSTHLGKMKPDDSTSKSVLLNYLNI